MLLNIQVQTCSSSPLNANKYLVYWSLMSSMSIFSCSTWHKDNVYNKGSSTSTYRLGFFELSEACISCAYGCIHRDQHPFEGCGKVVEATFIS